MKDANNGKIENFLWQSSIQLGMKLDINFVTSHVINDMKRILNKFFDMNDMVLSDVIFGIKILRRLGRIILLQSHYVEKVLKKFNTFIDCLLRPC